MKKKQNRHVGLVLEQEPDVTFEVHGFNEESNLSQFNNKHFAERFTTER